MQAILPMFDTRLAAIAGRTLLEQGVVVRTGVQVTAVTDKQVGAACKHVMLGCWAVCI